MKPIFIVTWETESGDSGTYGYWTKKPTKKYLTRFFKDKMPDEFEGKSCYVNWDVEEFVEVV